MLTRVRSKELLHCVKQDVEVAGPFAYKGGGHARAEGSCATAVAILKKLITGCKNDWEGDNAEDDRCPYRHDQVELDRQEEAYAHN